MLYLAQKLSTGGDKVTDDINEVDRRVNGHQPFLHDELGRVKLLNCLAKATNGKYQNDRGYYLHDQQAEDIQFFLRVVRYLRENPILEHSQPAEEQRVETDVDDAYDSF